MTDSLSDQQVIDVGSVFSREKEPRQAGVVIFINIYSFINEHKKLAHGAVEAEKSQDLQLTSWRPRSTNSRSSSPSLRLKVEDWCPSSKTG